MPEGGSVTLTVKNRGNDYIPAEDMRAAFPDCYAISATFHDDYRGDLIDERYGLNSTEERALCECFIAEKYGAVEYSAVHYIADGDLKIGGFGFDESYLLYVFNKEMDVIGICTAYDHGQSITLSRTSKDVSALRTRVLKKFESSFAKRNSLQVTVDRYTYLENGIRNNYYPLYVNGKKMTGEYYPVVYWTLSPELAAQPEKAAAVMHHRVLFGVCGGISDNDGNTWYGVLTDEYREQNYRFRVSWDYGQGKQIERQYGLYIDAVLDPQYIFVGVYSKSGDLLGYTILPPKT